MTDWKRGVNSSTSGNRGPFSNRLYAWFVIWRAAIICITTGSFLGFGIWFATLGLPLLVWLTFAVAGPLLAAYFYIWMGKWEPPATFRVTGDGLQLAFGVGDRVRELHVPWNDVIRVSTPPGDLTLYRLAVALPSSPGGLRLVTGRINGIEVRFGVDERAIDVTGEVWSLLESRVDPASKVLLTAPP
jgi:hypothetical protein